MGAVYDFYPVSSRPNLRVLVDGTTERMEKALMHIDEVGDVFWGHELGSGNERIPQTMNHKMGLLRDTVRKVSDIEEDYHMDSWLKLERHATETEVALLQKRKIGVMLPPELKSSFRRAPDTALQAYRTQSIRDMVHQHLSCTGNPVILIVEGFADFEANKPQINDRSRALGYSALELFAFSAGGQQFVEVVGAANLQFHQDELERRSLKRAK